MILSRKIAPHILVIAGSTLLSSPAIAATFSRVNSSVNIFNFSQAVSSTNALADANVSVTTLDNSVSDSSTDESSNIEADGGVAIAQSELDVLFLSTSQSLAVNSVDNIVIGQGFNYEGLADTETTVIGNVFLDVLPGSSVDFSFDFIVDSELQTFIDIPVVESATARMDTSFLLLDENQNIIDSFSLLSSINTVGEDNSPSIQNSDAFTVNLFDVIVDDTGLQQQAELIEFFISGSYTRTFTSPINLTLVQVLENEAAVVALAPPPPNTKIPEPSSTLTMLLLGSFLGVNGLRKLN